VRVIIDAETAGTADLKVVGAAKYLQHPNTEVLCISFKQGSETFPCATWYPSQPRQSLLDLIAQPDVVFVSHNDFEQYLWMYQMVPAGFPPLPPERWEDTMAACAYKAIPLGLDKAAKVLELPLQKDMEGNKLTLSLSRTYDRTPETLQRVAQYCETDVECEEMLDKRLGQLPPAELAIWRLTCGINQRGIKLDLDYVRAAMQIARDAAAPLVAECRDLTGGINPTQRDAVIAWCRGRGVDLENLTKDYLTDLLGDDDADVPDDSLADDGVQLSPARDVVLPPEVRRVLEIRQLCGSASVKKYPRMLECVCSDGRARGLQQYHAASTGRFGGRIIQPHNFPWDKEGVLARFDPVETIAAIKTGDYRVVEHAFGVSAITVVGLGLRHALVADDGMSFLVGDYSGIEARIVLALAGQYDKTELMASGADVYLDMACDIYGVPKGSLDAKLDGGKRQIGKNTVLGCGFQMGGAKFHDRYCPDQPLEFAKQVVDAYRTQWAPKVPDLWEAFQQAVRECVGLGRTVEAYGCRLYMAGEWMAIDLPSGWQTLWYFRPHMHTRPGWGPSPHCWAMKSGKWTRRALYGGLLTENVVQALARGLMCGAMGRLEVRHGMPIVMTVHDEIVAEVTTATADLDRFKAIMAEPPDWAQAMQIPIAVTGWCEDRYRK
jgi:DNA polymerase